MSDFDPTTNRITFHLLSGDEQTALRNWPWGWEFYSFNGAEWMPKERAAWYENLVYRGKPAPVVTSVWLNVYLSNISLPHKSRALSDCRSTCEDRIAVLRIDTCNGVSTAHLEEI